MKYFGMPTTVAKLSSQLEYIDEGTWLTQNGQLLLKAGLYTTFVSAHPHMLPADVISRSKTNAELREWLEKFFKAHQKNRAYQKSWKHLRDYLDAGGRVKPAIPSVRIIRDAINKNQPVIASIHGGALGRKEAYGYHFVVVNGYRPGELHVLNPYQESHQRAWWPSDQFMFAVHAGTMFDPDNGALLVASKSERM